MLQRGDRVTPLADDRPMEGTVERRIERGGLEAQIVVLWDNKTTSTVAESALRRA